MVYLMSKEVNMEWLFEVVALGCTVYVCILLLSSRTNKKAPFQGAFGLEKVFSRNLKMEFKVAKK